MIRLLLALMLLAAGAQARELKVATWNLNWLTLRRAGDPILPENVIPKSAEDRAELRRYAAALDADVVALQEVDGPEAAAELFPPERYVLFFTHDAVVQRVGFAIRRGIAVRQNPDLVGLDVTPDAHYRLRSGADVTLEVAGSRLRLLAVHLKSGCHEAPLGTAGRACALLRQQAAPLAGWIVQRREEGVPFLLLGDFNRRMDKREQLSSEMNLAAPLVRATEGRASPCWGGGAFIDHVFAGGAARGWLVANSLRVQVFRGAEGDKDRLSDHCPVSVRLQVPEGE